MMAGPGGVRDHTPGPVIHQDAVTIHQVPPFVLNPTLKVNDGRIARSVPAGWGKLVLNRGRRRWRFWNGCWGWDCGRRWGRRGDLHDGNLIDIPIDLHQGSIDPTSAICCNRIF